MPSFADSIFLFILALLLFGPKKLPVLARELGKWMGEFRRASNEFKMQMEEELRISEQEERQKKVAAMEAAAPVAPALEEPEYPHLPPPPADADSETHGAGSETPGAYSEASIDEEPAVPEIASREREPLPIATSGELSIMPPSTGLPVRRDQQDEDSSGHLPAAEAASESMTHAG